MMVELENILDSKIKKVRIELPHYSFSHSSSGESSHDFVGRKKIKEKLKKIVEATTDETGVYLVTGNRGVGKTSLVSRVITETSLQPNSTFSKNLKYLFVLLFSVVVTQFCLQRFGITQYCLQEFKITFPTLVFFSIFVLSFILLCHFNSYRRKIPKENMNLGGKICNFLIPDIKAAIKELFTLINPYNPYISTQYILKIILIVSFTQFFSIIFSITPTIAFIFYSVIALGYMFLKFIIGKWREYNHKYKKGELSKYKIKVVKEIFLVPIWNYIENHRRLYLRINFGHKLKDEKDILRLIARTLNTEYHEYLRLLKRMLPWRVMALGFLLIFAYLFSTIVEKQEFYKSIKESKLYRTSSQIYLNDLVYLEVKDFTYLKDSTYLKIKDSVYIKKDSVYVKKDFAHIKKDSIHIEGDSLYIKEDSIYLKAKDFFGIEKDKERLENAFVNDSCYKKDKEHLECIFTNDNDYKNRLKCVFINDNCPFNKAETFLLVLDQLVFEISKRVKKIPQILFCKDKIDFDKEFIPPISYLFWLSFFIMYLLCVLLFRCNWITPFFVTHRMIKQQLKKLNSDITYSTELENSINLKSESIGTKIGKKSKKSRGVADAREIEKELQDILENVRRIPAFMCRPNIVIVFDELDKVEPSESSPENENQKTKASLFSIDATRERQTEILKILSNMKYFLSTVKAKFIFIAGREMYDIYLADVSERNNYIGSIFNAVIYVPSFLTDPSDGNRDITSLIEKFVCRRLISNDYNRLEESYNLNEYRKYLEKNIYNDAKIEEIERKIQNIIDKQNKETKQKIIDLKCLKDIEIKQIQNIITDQSKEMEQKIIDLQTEKIERKIQNIIAKRSKKIITLKNGKKEQIQNIINKLNKKIDILKNGKKEQIQNIIDKQSKKMKKKIAAIKYIEQIQNTIDEQNEKIKEEIVTLKNREIGQIQKIIDEQSKKIVTLEDVKIEQIQNIIDELNKKIEQKIIGELNKETEQKIQKIIAVLQQFIIYLAHVSKGAPKKMMQFFESFIEVREIDKNEDNRSLVVQHYDKSRFFLTFNYYKQYTIGIIAYLITPIFYRLSESNIKEHSDKLLVSSLRFIDFLFKFHKHPFSWKHLDISPEMQEVNRSPALKSVTMDLLNYLAQVHINRSNFSFSDYTFNNLIADEISAMTKIDNVFSALFSFSLDEMLPLKKHYQDMLERTQKEYQNDINSPRFYLNDKSSPRFIDAISSLQVVLGDLHYYDDELEEAGVYYKNAVQILSNLRPKNDDKEKKGKKEDGKENEKEDETMTLEQHYLYVRNMLRLGMIYENRKQYDFAYLTYGEICKRIIRERDITIKGVSADLALIEKQGFTPNTNDMLFKKMTFEGLKMLYLPFIAKLQILEKSHVGGITLNHLEQLEKEFAFLTNIIKHKEAKLLKAEFYSRLADILYYKNSDLKSKKKKNSKEDKNKSSDCSKDIKNYSCTACHYYHKALSTLLDLDKDKNVVKELLSTSVKRIDGNYNMKYCTILARILSDWGNVFFSCDDKRKDKKDEYECYLCDVKDCNTRQTCGSDDLEIILEEYIDYVELESEEKDKQTLQIFLKSFNSRNDFLKMEIAFTMYAISLKAYTKSNLHKRSAYQILKMLRLFKYYKIYNYIGGNDYIEKLSKKAISLLCQANEELNIFEIKKRKKDFGKHTIEEKIPSPYILVDSEINRIWIFVKDLELKSNTTTEKLKEYYDMYITSPYEINYSISIRIYQLWLKSTINYEAYKMLIYAKDNKRELEKEMKFIFDKEYCNDNIKAIFNVDKEMRFDILERLIAETIFCFKEIIHLSKTMEETYHFNHIFMGSIHQKLTFWIRLYELYEEKCKKENKPSQIGKYLKKYLGEEWKEQLSIYYEKQKALSHYCKSSEMHNEGRAYHNMIDNKCYLKDDYNDRSDHFNIAEERHNILNGEIDKQVEKLNELCEDSGL